MANLFDLAPKELTQDGFLRWVFESYKEPDMEELTRDLVMFLTEGAVDIKAEDFTRLSTWSQVCHMDVGCDFFYKDNDKTSRKVLVIEDKTDSNEHNQLEIYNKSLKNWGMDRIIRVFYKTNPVEEEEAERVKKADWRLIPLDDIVGFWRKYLNHPNIIVRYYAEHIVHIGEASQTVKKPGDNDLVAWNSFFQKAVRPYLQETLPEANVIVGKTRYGYIYLNVYPKGRNEQNVPYMEIRSRDLTGDSFSARILKYGRDINLDSLKRLRETIHQKGDYFRCNWSEERVQQAAHTYKKDGRLSSSTIDCLLKSTLLCAQEYLKIVDAWLSIN